jgi:predicted aspartyl protease
VRDQAILPCQTRKTAATVRCLAGLLLLGLSARAVIAGDVLGTADPATGPDDSMFALPTTRDHIGRVLVPVTINGHGPFRFIVDTGANHSTIAPRTVLALGLTPTQETPFHVDGITGDAQVAFVTVDVLRSGDLTIDGAALPIIWAPVMAGADGILGAAGLTEKSLLIDFQRNRVEIAHHFQALGRSPAIKIHALRLTHGLITLDSVIGGVRTCAILDTGSERTLGNLALRDALKTQRKPGSIAVVTSVYGATQAIEPGELQRAPTIVLDGLRITDAEIVYGDFHIFKVWALDQKPALIIGMDVLGTLASLSIDFKNQDVYVEGLHNATHSMPVTRGDINNMAIKR